MLKFSLFDDRFPKVCHFSVKKRLGSTWECLESPVPFYIKIAPWFKNFQIRLLRNSDKTTIFGDEFPKACHFTIQVRLGFQLRMFWIQSPVPFYKKMAPIFKNFKIHPMQNSDNAKIFNFWRWISESHFTVKVRLGLSWVCSESTRQCCFI